MIFDRALEAPGNVKAVVDGLIEAKEKISKESNVLNCSYRRKITQKI